MDGLYREGKRMEERDMERNVAREWSGTVCVGMSQSPWPFGKLVIGPEAIEIRSMTRRYTIAREHVQSVEPAGIYPWCLFGVRIRHASEGDPRLQMFLPFLFWRRAPILKYAKSLEYNVP